MSETRATSVAERYQGAPPEIYEQHFVPSIGLPFAEEVLAAADLGPGDRVVDVACGTGVAARLAAARVGASGTVVGVDINPGALNVARAVAPDDGTIGWQDGDAEDLPFPDDSFDVALCSLGLQFFTNKVAALEEMRRVLVDDGRLATVTPGPTPPPFAAIHEILAERCGPEAAGFVEAVFSLHDADEITELLRAAGFHAVEARRGSLRLQLPGPADFFWQYMLGTPLAAFAAEMDGEARAEIEREVVDRWQPFTERGGLAIEPGLVLATARA